MAKASLRAGAEIDFLSSDEHVAHLERVKNDLIDHMRQVEGETISRASDGFTTDAAGGTSGFPDGAAGVYRVPVGYDAFLLRLTVDYEGSTAATPVTCDLRVVADSNTPSGLRSLANQVPNVFSASKSHAPLFRGGQSIRVAITGGPATTKFYAVAQVLLTKRKHLSSDVLAE